MVDTLPIADIKILRRHRRHFGDIQKLADSIEEVGLLHPIVINSDNILIAGERRIKAYKSLDRTEIPVHIINLDDIVRGENAENVDRKNYTPSEAVAIGRELEPLEEKASKERGHTHTKAIGGNFPPIAKKKTRDEVAKKIGMSSKTYEKAKVVVEAAEQEPEEYGKYAEEMDRTGKVDGVYRKIKRIREKKQRTIHAPADKSPRLIVAYAERVPQIANETVDLIITSPPYNLGREHWPMGGNGATPWDGIGYDAHTDDMPEKEYQSWQLACLKEMYRVAKIGASFFYNHKIRIDNGQMIHPLDWLRSKDNPWIIRQEIIWDRKSTHNHCPSLFWPEDERIYWMTKRKPTLPESPIGMSTVWTFPFESNTWHPAPFSEELPKRCIEALGRPGIVVLDPFAGSCTTLKVALSLGYDAIGVDLSQEYLIHAAEDNGWMTENVH